MTKHIMSCTHTVDHEQPAMCNSRIRREVGKNTQTRFRPLPLTHGEAVTAKWTQHIPKAEELALRFRRLASFQIFVLFCISRGKIGRR